MRAAEHGIGRQLDRRAARRARRSACRSPTRRARETTNARRARCARSFSRRMPRVARPSRLSVGSPLIRNRQPSRRFVRDARAVAAALLADDEHQADARLAVAPQPIGRRHLRGQNPFRVARSAAVQTIALDAARKERRHAVEVRREHDGGIGRRVASTLKRVSSTRCSVTAESEAAQVVGEPAAGVAFPAGRRIDVDERARERYRIHASSSVRVSVRESRYLTMTGVASERPHSGPLPAVTARAPGTTTAPSGTTSGRSAVRLDDLAAHEIVDRRRAGQHRAGGDDRARLDRPRLRRCPCSRRSAHRLR